MPHSYRKRRATSRKTRIRLVVPVPAESTKTLAAVRSAAVAAAERSYLERLLAAHDGRIDASALTAGVSTRQLRKLLTKHEIEKAGFKPPRPSRHPAPRPVVPSSEVDP